MTTIDKIVFSQNAPAKNTLWARPSEKGTELLIFNKGKWGTVGADDFQRFHYEVYSSLEDITEPKPNALYLIGPKGEGEDKYDEYVYTEEGFTKIGDTSIDMSGKEDVTTIVAPVNTTDATLPITTLTTEIGKYYRIDVPIETLGVTLPAMTDLTTVRTVVLYLTGGTTPAITISSTAVSGGTAPDVYYQDGFELEAGKTYEVNALFNGSAWIVDVLTIKVPFFAKLTLTDGSTVKLEGSGKLTKAMVSPYKASLVSAEIGELCTSIGEYVFFNSDMTSVTIPDSVTSIGKLAFGSCSGLTSITIPNSVTSFDQSAFQQCGLTSITIPDSVTSIGNEAFSYCNGLTSITIGSGVTSIGQYAFNNCTGLISITCNATTAPTIQSNTFQNVKTGGTLTVPSGNTGYDVWMDTGNYYLGKYNWTKVEQ